MSIPYNIIASGSKGNCHIYFNEIMIDVGLNYVDIEPHLEGIKIILLTHKHGDHFKPSTIRQIQQNHPNIIFGIPYHMKEDVKDIKFRKRAFLYNDKEYRIGQYIIRPQKLYHNVPNSGYHIYKGDLKMLHATDTGIINHVIAKHYDLYAIEFNHSKAIIIEDIKRKIENNEYAYQIQSRENHLAFEEAEEWLDTMIKEDSEVVMLHINNTYL